MAQLRLWVLLIVLLGAVQLAAQQSSKMSTRFSQEDAIARAEALAAKDPTTAIDILSKLTQQATPRKDLVRAYLLLGDIYTNIDQDALALDRYQSGVDLSNLRTDGDLVYQLNQRLGASAFRLGDYTQSRERYRSCLNTAPASSPIYTLCREGLADVEAATANLELSLEYYDDAEQNAAADSSQRARVNLKKANVALRQGRLTNSVDYLTEAVNTLPRKEARSVVVAEELVSTNRKLRRRADSLNVAYDLPALAKVSYPLVTATDNFTRFESARAAADFAEADAYLATALDNIAAATPSPPTTDILSAAADYYLERGRPELAAQTYRRYTAAKEAELTDLRQALDQQAAILRGQRGIDLNLKDQTAAASERRYESQRQRLQTWLIYLLLALLLSALIFGALTYRNVQRRRRANQELLLRNLQTRMNPHFIFNSLNSINNYIARQDERSANRFLGRFAKLMRSVLDNSGRDFILLADELEQLQLYLELERERFGEQFTYSVDVAEDLDPSDFDIPPMLLQPYVENAIWHGLRYRPEGGRLVVTVGRGSDAGTAIVTISDNGIGRTKSAELKTANQTAGAKRGSHGLEITRARIDLINQYYQRGLSSTVTDVDASGEYVGTQVTLTIN